MHNTKAASIHTKGSWATPSNMGFHDMNQYRMTCLDLTTLCTLLYEMESPLDEMETPL